MAALEALGRQATGDTWNGHGIARVPAKGVPDQLCRPPGPFTALARAWLCRAPSPLARHLGHSRRQGPIGVSQGREMLDPSRAARTGR